MRMVIYNKESKMEVYLMRKKGCKCAKKRNPLKTSMPTIADYKKTVPKGGFAALTGGFKVGGK